MINEIIDGIRESIFAEFGEEYEVFTEPVKQGFLKPCFYIYWVNSVKEGFNGKSFKLTNGFEIQYFPLSASCSRECNGALERLFTCLESITVNGTLLEGTHMSVELAEGGLKFHVTYDAFLYEAEDEGDKMESFSLDGCFNLCNQARVYTSCGKKER